MSENESAVSEEDLIGEAQKLLEQEKNARIGLVRAQILSILEAHNCTMEAVVVIRDATITSKIDIIAK